NMGRSSAGWSTRECWHVRISFTAAASAPITRPKGSNYQSISAKELLAANCAGAARPLTSRPEAEILVLFVAEEKVPRAEQRDARSGTAEKAHQAGWRFCARRVDCGCARGARRRKRQPGANRLRPPGRRLHQCSRCQWRSVGVCRALRARQKLPRLELFISIHDRRAGDVLAQARSCPRQGSELLRVRGAR